jgi:hypothetical protein
LAAICTGEALAFDLPFPEATVPLDGDSFVFAVADFTVVLPPIEDLADFVFLLTDDFAFTLADCLTDPEDLNSGLLESSAEHDGKVSLTPALSDFFAESPFALRRSSTLMLCFLAMPLSVSPGLIL